jgi:hypothetical protein
VFVVRTERFTPSPGMSQSELHAENLHAHQWWSIDEMQAHSGCDNFSPPDIAMRLQQFVSSNSWTPLHIVQHNDSIVSERPL